MVINKIDTLKKQEEILTFIDAYKDVCDFAEIVPLSALKEKNTDLLLDLLFKYLPYGPMFYDEDTVTDQPMRQIASELIREKALRLLNDEIPHGIAVTIEKMRERGNKIMDIEASIVCERDSHKASSLEGRIHVKENRNRRQKRNRSHAGNEGESDSFG